MKRLITLARQHPQAPFAAMIVDAKKGEVLSEGLNNAAANPTAHGEIVAINNFAKLHPERTFDNTILYTTAEPCPMCMSAIIWAKIPMTVYGTSISFLSKNGWRQIDIRSQEVIERATPFYQGEVIGGVLNAQTNPLFVK